MIVFCPLPSAPSSTPQNIHVIQRDPGLVLEWEGVAPDVLKENVLGYRLEWIQDNVTQVTDPGGAELLHAELENSQITFLGMRVPRLLSRPGDRLLTLLLCKWIRSDLQQLMILPQYFDPLNAKFLCVNAYV